MAAFMLNRRVRQLLQEKGITQVRLAEDMDLNPGYVSELLNDHPEKRWNIDHIESLCKFLGVDPWQLFVDPLEATFPGKELVVAYDAAPKHKQLTINDILGLAQDDGNNPQAELKKSTTDSIHNSNQPHKGHQ